MFDTGSAELCPASMSKYLHTHCELPYSGQILSFDWIPEECLLTNTLEILQFCSSIQVISYC